MRTAVIGAAGYGGGEVVRLALGHPELDLVQATSRKHAGQPVGRVHPNLRHHDLRFTSPESLESVEIAFVALPAGEFAGIEERVTAAAGIVVDLGPDFRDSEDRADPGYVTGLPELFRESLVDARRISVPGCMATAAAIAIRPLAAAGLLVEPDVVVDARTGSSGAGASPSDASHHPERQHAMRVYRPTGHRHEREIDRMCSVRSRMTVTAVPLVRGVQVIAHARMRASAARADMWDAFRSSYGEEPFVRLVAQRAGVHRLPDPQFLAGSNFCDIGFDVDEDGDRIVVVAALDNLMKGAAGGAVQSLNVALGMSERTGLEFAGLHPV